MLNGMINRRSMLLGTAGLITLAQLGTALGQSVPTLFVAVTDRAPTTTDPMQSQNGGSTDPLFSNVQDRITALGHEGETIPGVCTWEIVDDGKEVVFTLKPGVKFHSGDDLTADDIVFSHERGMELSASYRGRWNTLDRVERVDELTVRFIFTEPNINILYNNALFIGSKAYHERVGEDEYTKNPVGTGPYRLTSYDAGQYYQLDAWQGYWGPQPVLKSVKIAVVADAATRVNMLRAGEADFIHATPYHEVATLENEGFHMVMAKTFPTVALGFQNYNRDVPWADVRVRLAMAHAIDCKAIVDGLFRGIPELTAMWSPGEVGYDPALLPHTFDPEKSRALLTEAGYENGFEFPMSVATSAYGLRETAEAMAIYFQQVGIIAKIEVVDSSTLAGIRRERGSDPTFVFTLLRAMILSNFGDPAASLAQSMGEGAPTSTYTPDSPEVFDLIRKGLTQLDNDGRAETVKKVSRILHEEAAIIPIWNSTHVYAMKKGFAFTPINHFKPLFQFGDIQPNG